MSSPALCHNTIVCNNSIIIITHYYDHQSCHQIITRSLFNTVKSTKIIIDKVTPGQLSPGVIMSYIDVDQGETPNHAVITRVEVDIYYCS